MNLLTINNLHFNFTPTQHALQKINYQINSHDFIILLGSNGSGKSTLLKLIQRQHLASQGEILLLDKNINHYSGNTFANLVTSITQNCDESLFTHLTLYENYLLFKTAAQPAKRDFLKNYLTQFNVNLANKINDCCVALSGGEKQALALAFCFLNPPKLLLLDEHTSALDPKTATQIMQITQQKICEHQITCVLTTHDLNLAEQYGNRILVLKNGEIFEQFEKDQQTISREFLKASCF